MPAINLKKVLEKGLWFCDLGTVFKTLARWRGERPFFFFEGRTWSYGEALAQSWQYARLFQAIRQRRIETRRLRPEDQLAVGIYLDNCAEFAFSLFGAALSGSCLIAVNTGFRGEILAGVLNTAEIGALITSEQHLAEVEQSLPRLESIGEKDVLLVGPASAAEAARYRPLEEALRAPELEAAELPRRVNLFTPLIVIYTSGTTGPPKGVPCSQVKLLAAGALTARRLRLGREDVGYVCMPMFHSNAWYLGIMPTLVGGGSFVLKRRFSASAFEEDILEHGVTFMNYVGQPIHYILAALEKKYSSPEGVEAALARHPKNRFRTATGNGATPRDRQKMIRYLGMDHIYELYGSTEAPINTCLKPGDPIDSVGQITSKKVVIIDENDQLCPEAEVDASGRIINYDKAVGEIARIMEQDNIFFDGYFKNEEATSKKFRSGFFRSGDLGYVRIINGKRYLYFVGRTDDWIRKDGENFSAESVVPHVLAMPGVSLAAVYGAPCEVADEKVMAALLLNKDTVFDPKAAFEWFRERQKHAGMDPKWMPDYIRIVDSFEMTHQTQKILVRPLKREHFNLEKCPSMRVYFRRRGDETYHELTPETFAEIKKLFAENGREHLL